jgi:hypothetical protein
VQRYNLSGGAWYNANPTLRPGIKYVECWNEPFITTEFFAGTTSQMVDMAWAINLGIKTDAGDATTVILSPGDNQMTGLQTWLAATGTTFPGQTGNSTCDGFAMHFYDHALPGTTLGSDWSDVMLRQDIAGLYNSVYAWRVLAGPGGIYPTKSLYLTESGLSASFPPGSGMNFFLAMPVTQRFQYVARRLMYLAAMGVKCVVMYCWDTVFSAHAGTDPNGVAAAFTAIHNNVAGKTISSATYNVGAEVTLNFNDGSSYAI